MVAKTDKLVRYLCKRQPPLNNTEISQRTKDIEDKIFAEGKHFIDIVAASLSSHTLSAFIELLFLLLWSFCCSERGGGGGYAQP